MLPARPVWVNASELLNANRISLEVRQLESILRKYEHKTVEEFADGYYSSALAVYNSMYQARQLLATFDDDAA